MTYLNQKAGSFNLNYCLHFAMCRLSVFFLLKESLIFICW